MTTSVDNTDSKPSIPAPPQTEATGYVEPTTPEPKQEGS